MNPVGITQRVNDLGTESLRLCASAREFWTSDWILGWRIEAPSDTSRAEALQRRTQAALRERIGHGWNRPPGVFDAANVLGSARECRHEPTIMVRASVRILEWREVCYNRGRPPTSDSPERSGHALHNRARRRYRRSGARSSRAMRAVRKLACRKAERGSAEILCPSEKRGSGVLRGEKGRFWGILPQQPHHARAEPCMG